MDLENHLKPVKISEFNMKSTFPQRISKYNYINEFSNMSL